MCRCKDYLVIFYRMNQNPIEILEKNSKMEEESIIINN